MKGKIGYAIFALIFSLLAVSCSGGSDIPPNEEIFFSDKNGAEFSLQTTSCADGKSNGKITLRVYDEKDYLYSLNGGKTFQKIRGGGISLNGISRGSSSFCLMESGDPQKITDIYTIYVGDRSEQYPLLITAESSAEKLIDDGKITIRTENFTEGTEYEATADGWKTSKSFFGGTAEFDSLGQGLYAVSVREKNDPAAVSPILSAPVVHAENAGGAYIDVDELLQNPELPTGCEAVSLTMLLNYIGFDADKLTIADEYLPKGEYRRSDFNKVFVGDPRSRQAYGCTAGVIAETAEKYLADHDVNGKWQVKNISGCSAEVLYSAVENRIPVVVWASIDMGEIIEDYVVWTDEETGNEVSWYGGEHCLLLTGYDKSEGVVYFNDPLRGKTSYDMRAFEKRFEELDRNAVIITENQP